MCDCRVSRNTKRLNLNTTEMMYKMYISKVATPYAIHIISSVLFAPNSSTLANHEHAVFQVVV